MNDLPADCKCPDPGSYHLNASAIRDAFRGYEEWVEPEVVRDALADDLLAERMQAAVVLGIEMLRDAVRSYADGSHGVLYRIALKFDDGHRLVFVKSFVHVPAVAGVPVRAAAVSWDFVCGRIKNKALVNAWRKKT